MRRTLNMQLGLVDVSLMVWQSGTVKNTENVFFFCQEEEKNDFGDSLSSSFASTKMRIVSCV